MRTDELRKQVTGKLIEMMQSGNDRPWRQPWSFGPNHGVPTSAATGKPYRGSNAVTLDLAAMILGYKSKNWNTFNNWKAKDIYPKQGSKATWAMWFGKRGIEGEDENGEKTTKYVPTMKSFCLFNAEQCHGEHIDDYLCKPVDNPELYKVNYDQFDELIKRHGIVVMDDQGEASHDPTSKKIRMPKRGYFENVAAYYATLAHEICHWAEDVSGNGRGNRTQENYADYELSAEIGSAYLLRELGLPVVETERTLSNSAIYLKTWLKRLKDDDSYIFKASGRAGRLVDYLIGREEKKEKTEESKELVNV